ncbi:MAG: hypothetical protein A3F09_02700 [Chlamydiae bacterium RIFCSPHIGHO2_12_FULL_49_11]|nr:MAG: hypothetical protein A3F09_02700 [Chlamydiae bacterium RIFCSPHIGHO2_12_FULL_49_11]
MIHIKNLFKQFGPNKVLQGLSLEISNNEILVIVGRSGSGKSVLIKHIMGLMKPDSGEVLIDEIDMTQLEGPKLYSTLTNIGMIFQMGALFDSMTIEENVGFFLKEHQMVAGKKIQKSDMKEIVRSTLAKVGIEGTMELYPADLSGGMRKRASIARSVIYKPKYLFYDEPTTGLDPVTAENIGRLIVAQQNELQGTSVVVSHDIATSLMIADRIALIENGVIEVIAKPKEFMEYNHPTIRKFNHVVGDYKLHGSLR